MTPAVKVRILVPEPSRPLKGMSFSSWIDTRIQNALDDLLPKLTTALAADTSPIVQSVVTGVLDALTTQIEGIPQDTTKLLGNELDQIPQQVSDILNVPEAIATAVAGLPAQIVADIKGLIPFATPAPKGKTTK